MRRVAFLILLACCVGLTGCSSLNPKNWTWPSLGKKKAKPDADPVASPDAANAPAVARDNGNSSSSVNGVLAGRVIDAYNRSRPGAVIQVASAEESANDQPQEVTANDQGYFTIQNLHTGKRYRLTARAKSGDATIGGTTLATPPNVVLLIKVNEELGPNEAPSKARGSKSSDQRRGNVPPSMNSDQSFAPDSNPKYLHEQDRGANDRIAPIATQPSGPNVGNDPSGVKLGSPSTPNRQRVPTRPENIANNDIAKNTPPVRVEIPGAPGATPFPPQSSWGNGPSRGGAAGASGFAFCTGSDTRIEDFSLPDLSGQPYQFSNRKSKLVLLDFWMTSCRPCIQAMPFLGELQQQYGPKGLEVIGVTYEEGPQQAKIDRINFVRQRQGVSYRMLLGDGENCPLMSKLDVKRFPTVILLDETGQVVFRGEGMSVENKARLEAEIRKRIADE